VFQSAIMEAKKYKASGGDALADVLDLLSSGPGDAAHPKPSAGPAADQVL
jgi:hypothetical protein